MNKPALVPGTNQATDSRPESIPQSPVFEEILGNLGSPVAVLTPDRKMAYANPPFASLIHQSEVSTILGLRLGQGFDCIHLIDGHPCGENPDCQLCGANNAILAAGFEKPTTRECRILRKESNEALDLEVTASRIKLNSRVYILVTVNDISHRKRRRTLERIFFHDILNGISSLLMAVELMRRTGDTDKSEYYLSEIQNTAKRMLSDINSQKLLSSAENGDLKTNREAFSLGMLLEDLVPELTTLANDKNCGFVNQCDVVMDFYTDYSLLSRVLINAVKNAVEASAAGLTVTLSVTKQDDSVLFAVHNATLIPEEIRNQIFKRSFSTKAQDRGLGTYSIKILTENYLQGKVWFTSSQKNGTTFFIQVPPMCV